MSLLYHDELSNLIAKNYQSRPVRSTDPAPIIINCLDLNGPLNLSKGYVMCNVCGSKISENYLNNHRKSGACLRKNLGYNGPYVHIK